MMIFINNLPPLLCPVVTLTDDSAGTQRVSGRLSARLEVLALTKLMMSFQWVKDNLLCTENLAQVKALSWCKCWQMQIICFLI